MTVAGPGLPRPRDLDPLSRALYTGSVGFDYALRTGLAMVLAGAFPVSAVSLLSGAERGRLRFYVDLAENRDASRVFLAPPPVRVRSEPGHVSGLRDATVEILRFDSPFEAVNPAVRGDYAKHRRNAVARAQHWRHVSGPRPTLVVVHGFGASPAWFNSAFFGLREVFVDGWDVLLYTLPFHGSRRGPLAPVNGTEIFAHGMAQFTEAIIHAVHDLRAFVDHLEASGVERIGLTGLSLGGYTTALTAAVDARLDFAVPNAAVTWLPPLLSSWFPASVTARVQDVLRRMPRGEFERALSVTSPLTYRPVLPKERLMIVAGLGDRLAPPEQSEMLWEHWDRPALHWFPGSHILHFGRTDYRAAIRSLMHERTTP